MKSNQFMLTYWGIVLICCVIFSGVAAIVDPLMCLPFLPLILISLVLFVRRLKLRDSASIKEG